MANNAAGGAGALLSGLAGGYVGGMQLQNMMANQKKPTDPNHQSTGTAVQNAANQPGTLGTPGAQVGQNQQVTSLGLPDQGVPVAQQAALPSTPEAKSATNQSTGMWGTIAGYYNPQG